MNKEEKDLLLKDLCARLPHKVKCFAKDNEYGDIGTLYSIDPFDNLDPNIYIQYDKGNVISFFISEIKAYLRPMSSMTEEEYLYIEQNYRANEYGDLEKWSYGEGGHSTFDIQKEVIPYIDWLNSHHFDYRGLIKLNLAIDCTNLHIYD